MAQEEQEDTRRERRTEPARLYPQRAPDSKKLTQTKHERNQAELPMRLGVDSRESGRSRTKPLVRHKAKLARTGEGTRASSESSEPVPCGKRCRRCSTIKEKRVSKGRTQSACRSPTRSSLNPEYAILRPQLHAQPEPCAEVARCEVGACPE